MFHVYLVLFSNNFYSLISCLILWFLSYFFNISYMTFMFYVLYSIYIVLGSNVFVVSADSYSCWVIIFMSYYCELIWGYTLGMLYFREDLWCFAGIQGCYWPGTTQVPFWGGSQFTLRIPTLLLVQGFSTVVMVGICFQDIYLSFLYWGLVNLILVHGLFSPLMACKPSKFHFSCEIWLFCKGKFPQNTWISFHSRHLALPNIILYNIYLLIYCFTASLPTRI